MGCAGPRRGGRAMKMGWLLVLLLMGCGGETQPVSIESNGEVPVVPTGGTVSLINRTTYLLEVAYLNEVEAADPHIVRTSVPAGERMVISGAELPAGLEVEFDLVLVPATVDAIRVRRTIRVFIDGDQVLAVLLADATDPFTLEIESAV